MFAPTGYTALNSIFSETLGIVERHKERDAPLESYADQQSIYLDTCQVVWGFAEQMAKQKNAFVQSPAGEKMPADETVFEHFDPFQPVGMYIDISTGTIGSGDGRTWPPSIMDESEYKLFWSNYMKEKFGPNLYCPIIIPISFVNHFYDEVVEYLSGKKFDENKIIQNLLDLFQADASLTKRELKQKAAPNLTDEVFKGIWKEATRLNPDLSKPGPRKMR